MNSAFYRYQINDYISGHVSRPQKPENESDQARMLQYESDLKYFKDKDGLAKSIIYDTLSQDYRSTFEWKKSAKENMDQIKLKVIDYSRVAIRNMKRTLEKL
jgi:hypothetical protein